MTTRDLLIPVRRAVAARGRFAFRAAAVLASPSEADLVPLGQLRDDLAASGVRARIERNAFGPAAVRVRRDKSVTGPEAYRVAVTPHGVEIAASADAGAYYGVQTLRELVAAAGTARGVALAACQIDDAPDFARRGVYLDCSRGKVPRLQTLLALVERLARWKINELQLYVENVFTWRRHPAIGRGYSPFTPEELLAVQDHCRRHHIRFVGSLASFGHLEKVLRLPAYQHLGELPGFRGLPGGTTLCPSDPGSLRLVEEMVEEFVPLFEAEDFNVCCDETWELGRGRSRARAARVGLGRVYLDFLLKIHRLCRRHGKRMNAWADIVLEHPEMLGEMPRDIVMLNWDYDPKGTRIGRTREIVSAGLPAMVCPGTNAWNSHGCRLEMGTRNIAAFAAEGLRCGVEGVLNTDWGDNGHRNMLAISLHNYAYGAAHSWRHRGTDDRGFTERFCRHTFGPAGDGMPDAIRTLGRAHEAMGLPYANGGFLYNAFLTPIRRVMKGEDWTARALPDVPTRALADHHSALAALKWPAPRSVRDPFLRIALEEYATGTRLDMASCLRAAAIQKMMAGRSPSRAEWRHVIDETTAAARQLERVWLLGNKPSRLIDNLRGMRRSVAEMRRQG
ncbi:MAG: beta-N-acetylhexosaminidase [Planctomycetes bacterium]|nr:beta-N-acetylhexosaminidase [Planctomycetota bacterium]